MPSLVHSTVLIMSFAGKCYLRMAAHAKLMSRRAKTLTGTSFEGVQYGGSRGTQTCRRKFNPAIRWKNISNSNGTRKRYEYFNGEVFCMSGVKRNHAQIEGNLNLSLRLAVPRCRVYGGSLRVNTPSMPPYRYPDLSVVCEDPRFEVMGGLDVLTNLILIIEVLSPTTEAYDRGDKFTYYKSISSFAEYLLVAQHRPHVTHYVKQGDGIWSYEELNDLSDTVYLATVDCSLALAEIYRDVEFSSDASSPYGLTPAESK